MKFMVKAGLALSASFLATVANAKDKEMPPVPCPIDGQLRVAGTGSLSGFQMLDGCTADKIVVAPATPREYVEMKFIRDGSDADPARPMMASSGGVDSVRIVPKFQEVDYDAGVGSDAAPSPPLDASGATILAMRPVSYSTPYDDMITRVAERHRIDPLLLHAVIKQESSYKPQATSHVGARGLMQLMPGTARMLGVGEIAHPESNVDGGARLLRKLYKRYNDFPLVLAAYNAGEGAVAKYGNRIPPYAETQQYVQKVMANYRRLLSEQSTVGR